MLAWFARPRHLSKTGPAKVIASVAAVGALAGGAFALGGAFSAPRDAEAASPVLSAKQQATLTYILAGWQVAGQSAVFYCLSPDLPAPTSPNQVDNGIQDLAGLTALDPTPPQAGVTADTLAGINSAVTKEGQDAGALGKVGAVALATKYAWNSAGLVRDFYKAGYAKDAPTDVASLARWVGYADPAYSETATLAAQYYDQIESATAPAAVPAHGAVMITGELDAASDFAGTLTVSDMTVSPGTGTMTLTNGVFADSGEASLTGSFSTGQSMQIIGSPPLNTGDDGYVISAEIDLTAGSSGSASAPLVEVVSTAGQQLLIGPGGSIDQVTKESGSYSDAKSRQVPQVTTTAQAETSPGATIADDYQITGPDSAFPVGGVDLLDKAYLVDGVSASAADQCTDANLLATYPPVTGITTAQSGTLTAPSELPVTAKSGAQHVANVETLVVHETGRVIAQGACGEAQESTPIKDVNVTTTPPRDVTAGDAVRDTITVNGFVAPDTTVVVTQYQVPLGETLVCTAENQIGPSLPAVAIRPGQNTDAVYRTALTGAQVAGNAGFVASLYVGSTLISTSGCLDETFSVAKPATKVPALHLPVVAG